MLVGMQNGTATLEDIFGRLNIFLYNPAIVLSGICSNNLKIYVHTISVYKHIAALLIIVVTWVQPRCVSVGEWVNCITVTQWNVFHIKQK